MERLYHIASIVRTKLFCASTSRRAGSMDPMVQSAWMATLPDERSALDEIDADIVVLEQHLQAAVEKEQFIGVRIRAYQKQLERSRESNPAASEQPRNEEMAEHNDESLDASDLEVDDDAERGLMVQPNQEDLVEGGDDQHRKEEEEKENAENEKHAAALASVRAIHFDLLVQCEEMRRQLQTLHTKRDALRKLQHHVDALLDRPQEEEDEGENDEEGAIELPETRTDETDEDMDPASNVDSGLLPQNVPAATEP
jgi:hypothetical protein